LSGSQAGEFDRFIHAIDPRLRSHPNKSLRSHLLGVWQLAHALQTHLKLPLEVDLLQLASLTHDIGKAHPGFQAYLIEDDITKGPHHAAPSAWWTLALASELKLPFEKAFWGAEVVRRHHTGLKNFRETLNDWNDDAAAAARLENWHHARGLLPNYPINFEENGLPELDDLFWDIDCDPGIDTWLDFRLLYSLLVASDRMDALGIENFSFHPIPKLEMPIFENAHSPINRWRQQIQEDCFSHALETVKEPGIYSLTLPTGAGKTITGLRIASSLAKRNDLASLIYILPFISIVEQTADTARQCFQKDLIQEDHSLVLIDADETASPWQRMLSQFRYWQQPVLISTMAQFWESLFNSRANHTMNFHRLANAVIILDEPQTLPPKFWQGLGQLLDFLAKHLGSYFLLMTATQPHISRYSDYGFEIAPHRYQFPKVRHCYQVRHTGSAVSLSEIEEILIEERLLDDAPEGLIVLNTKRSALETFNLVEDLLGDDKQVELLYLSTWLTPWRRRKVLDHLKTIERQDNPRILISTQVVEAGVDLDFNWVIRDFGPFDSIIQVAGRCNRHGKRDDTGRVFITNLKDDRGRSFAGYVYDKILLEATRDILAEKTEFDEKEVPGLIDAYYHMILDRLTPEDLVGNLKAGKWGTMPNLYPETPERYIQVVVEETDEVVELIHVLETTDWNLNNLHQKRSAMRRLQQYVIEIPVKMKPSMDLFCAQIPHTEPLLKEILGGQMLFLSRKLIGDEKNKLLYHQVKGFIPPDDDPSMLAF
jgi:CRISPR-associated endonuclease/helicase Cas3